VIRREHRAGVTVLVLDRPERANALAPDLLEALHQQLAIARQEEQPLVLTATGRAFCPGADLKWLCACRDPALAVADLVAVHHAVIALLLEMRAPVVAAINGIVAGGGLGLALAADYRVAARAATFTAAYFRLGLPPDGGASAFLERTIGVARTMELLLTNRTLTAAEALDWGMVNEVVDDEQLVERAVRFAGELPKVPAYTLLQTRRLLDVANIHNQLQLESVAIRTAARGEFFRQALQQFGARRVSEA
jgi:2-(1,2-epoxy-1,2-dihydrophenyl)acetyl-CoA isomerase